MAVIGSVTREVGGSDWFGYSAKYRKDLKMQTSGKIAVILLK